MVEIRSKGLLESVKRLALGNFFPTGCGSAWWYSSGLNVSTGRPPLCSSWCSWDESSVQGLKLEHPFLVMIWLSCSSTSSVLMGMSTLSYWTPLMLLTCFLSRTSGGVSPWRFVAFENFPKSFTNLERLNILRRRRCAQRGRGMGAYGLCQTYGWIWALRRPDASHVYTILLPSVSLHFPSRK